MNTTDVIILGKIIITPLLAAQKSFEIALQTPKTDLNCDASIQRFKFSYELAWKTLKRVLNHQGIMVNSPRNVFRDAAKEGLLDYPKAWFTFLELRNLTTHTYQEAIAEKIYQLLPQFKQELATVIERIKKL